jgi:glucose-6-phosphate dehydrogenase assembly protein OpcA
MCIPFEGVLMPTTYKVLALSGAAGGTGNGAQALTATTNTNLYTVPAATSTVVSTITVCNQASTAATFRIAVRPAGAAIDNRHYIAYDTPIAANDTIALTLGITLAATDIITVYASAATMSFTAFGSEIS